MELSDLVKTFGLLDAVLLAGIVAIWREWRKSEAKTIELLHAQITVASDAAIKYSQFEGAIRGLTEVIKGKG